ncbi:hypothetical protein F2Q69_00044680 [Brassica cretica]|uniref:Uncharacterized protein n=1 Tax=Brassica cretica TaxID=69181 RepID=A0A8S9N4Z5_BRACR|nr:hypothetical protein F2Q69_00044680 [Brassica cretica]
MELSWRCPKDRAGNNSTDVSGGKSGMQMLLGVQVCDRNCNRIDLRRQSLELRAAALAS